MNKESQDNIIVFAEANKQKLAEAIEKAKGTDEAIVFAKKSGISQPTFSRMLNGKYTKRISDELLVKVAKNANPSSGITLELLRTLNGTVTKDVSYITSIIDVKNIIEKRIIDKNKQAFKIISEGKIGDDCVFKAELLRHEINVYNDVLCIIDDLTQSKLL